MASPFATRDAKLSGAIDRAFGEAFTFYAKAIAGDDVDLPRIADATRADFDVTGVWDGPAKSQTPHARGAIQDDNAHSWSASVPSVSVQDDLMPWRPKMGDWIMRKFDNSTYQLSSPLPDGMGRTIFKLTAKKRPPVVTAAPPALKFNAAGNSQFVPLI